MNDTQALAETEDELVDNRPLAVVAGEPYNKLPQDLYIPPDALEVFLEAFEGPLDLLLYLIKRQNLDILDIPIASITAQYMEYVDVMKDMRLELAGEYLVMAAMLAEIKSRMMLPRPTEEEDEEDPRAELVRRLQEYERYKQAAQDIDALPQVGRDVVLTEPVKSERLVSEVLPDVALHDLLTALKDVMSRADMFAHHHIQRETLSVRERMGHVLSLLKADEFIQFSALFDYKEGRGGVVVTFLAILELMKSTLIELVQNEPYGPIHVKAVQ